MRVFGPHLAGAVRTLGEDGVSRPFTRPVRWNRVGLGLRGEAQAPTIRVVVAGDADGRSPRRRATNRLAPIPSPRGGAQRHGHAPSPLLPSNGRPWCRLSCTFDSRPHSVGAPVFTAKTPGTFYFACAYHQTMMRGAIVVKQ